MESYDFEKLISDLNYKAMPMSKYQKKVKSGELAKWSFGIDDREFYRKYPNHPEAIKNRSRRMGAADEFYRVSKNHPDRITQDILDILHKALFDSCAAVRHSISRALQNVGNETSLPHLKKLLKIENESKAVKQETRTALETISGERLQEDIVPDDVDWQKLVHLNKLADTSDNLFDFERFLDAWDAFYSSNFDQNENIDRLLEVYHELDKYLELEFSSEGLMYRWNSAKDYSKCIKDVDRYLSQVRIVNISLSDIQQLAKLGNSFVPPDHEYFSLTVRWARQIFFCNLIMGLESFRKDVRLRSNWTESEDVRRYLIKIYLDYRLLGEFLCRKLGIIEEDLTEIFSYYEKHYPGYLEYFRTQNKYDYYISGSKELSELPERIKETIKNADKNRFF